MEIKNQELRASRLAMEEGKKEDFAALLHNVETNYNVVSLRVGSKSLATFQIVQGRKPRTLNLSNDSGLKECRRHGKTLHKNCGVVRFRHSVRELRFCKPETMEIKDKNDRVVRVHDYDVKRVYVPRTCSLFATFGDKKHVVPSSCGRDSWHCKMRCIPDDTIAFESALTELSRSLAYSVLKKCISGSGIKKDDPGAAGDKKHKSADGGCWSPALIKLRASIARDSNRIDQLRRGLHGAVDGACRWQLLRVRTIRVKRGGLGARLPDYIPKTPKWAQSIMHTGLQSLVTNSCACGIKQQLESAVMNIIGNNYGDGYDLVQVATLTVLQELQKQYFRDWRAKSNLSATYMDSRLERHVYAQWSDYVPKLEVKETTGIKECFQAVRRAVRASGHVAYNPRSGYVYIDDMVAMNDPVTGELRDYEIYRRLPKFYDLGGFVRDYNGAFGVYSASFSALLLCDDIDCITNDLHLPPKQMQVLDYRLHGYGWKKIGSMLGVTQQTVNGYSNRIGAKLVAWYVNHGGTESGFMGVLHGLPEFREKEEKEKEEKEEKARVARRAKLENYVSALIAKRSNGKKEEGKTGIIVPAYYVRAYGDNALQVYSRDVADLKSRPSFVFPGLNEGIILGYNDYFGDWDC